MSTMRQWRTFCDITEQSYAVTPAGVGAFIAWWKSTPSRESYKPYDTMKGYLKHLAHLQYLQQAALLELDELKALPVVSFFKYHDVQIVK
jgi:hypothetical protein